MMKRCATTFAAIALLSAPAVHANTSHEGWPKITGMLLMNKTDRSRPLDARPGHDPFAGTDLSYSCDAAHRHGDCNSHLVACERPDAGACRLGGWMVARSYVHNELLGGHGNDTIHAGPSGDVIWGDYKPLGQPTIQVDHLYGGPGNDIIYASHGLNDIYTGTRGRDRVHAHFGRGEIHCGSGADVVYLSRRHRWHYKLFGCRHVSYETVGY